MRRELANRLADALDALGRAMVAISIETTNKHVRATADRAVETINALKDEIELEKIDFGR